MYLISYKLEITNKKAWRTKKRHLSDIGIKLKNICHLKVTIIAKFCTVSSIIAVR